MRIATKLNRFRDRLQGRIRWPVFDRTPPIQLAEIAHCPSTFLDLIATEAIVLRRADTRRPLPTEPVSSPRTIEKMPEEMILTFLP